MKPATITQTLAKINTRPDEIKDEQVAADFQLLLGLIEEISQAYEQLKAENQTLRDAFNLLKGEQVKPDIKGSKKEEAETKEGDISSEKERKSRKEPSEKKSKSKKHKIKIDRTKICKVDQNILPEDAQFKGHQGTVNG